MVRPEPAAEVPADRRIRVAQVITSVVLGGGGQFMSALARNIDRDAVEMDVYCVLEGGEFVEYIRSLGYRVEVLPICRGHGLLRYDLRQWARLAEELRRGRYDIVHTSLFRADLVGAIAAKVAGRRILIKTLHNMGTRKRTYHRLVDAMLSRITDRIVCVAGHQRLVAIERDGIRPDQVVEIRNGVCMDRFEQPVDRTAVAASVGLDPARPIVGTVGRLIVEKGQEFLLRAMPAICARVPAAQLLIVGDGELRGALERQAQDLGMGGRIVITGLRPDVPQLLGVMDVYAFPSLSEGSPIAALEAMAAGVPLACSDIPALQELVRDGHTGLVVPARDAGALAHAICRLLEEREFAAGLAMRARELVRSGCSESAMVRAYERLYAEELSRKRRGLRKDR